MMKFSTSLTCLCSLAMAMATPLAAQAPESGAEASAHIIAVKMLPAGVYTRMMATVLPNIMNQMTSAMPALVIREALKSGGVPAEKVNQLSPQQMNEIIAIIDPAQSERMKIVQSVIMEENARMLTAYEPELRKAYERAFLNRYTTTQLADIAQFANTPAGEAFLSDITQLGADPAIQAQIKQLMADMIQKMPGFMDLAKAKAANLPAPRQLKDLSPEQKARLKALLGPSPAH